MNRKPGDTNRYEILLGSDGVFEELVATAPTYEDAKYALRWLNKKHRFQFDDMAIADSKTGRLVSYLL